MRDLATLSPLPTPVGIERYPGSVPPAASSLLHLLGILEAWRERSASRRALARLDDRLLCDIALDRASARAEAAKPFWRR